MAAKRRALVMSVRSLIRTPNAPRDDAGSPGSRVHDIGAYRPKHHWKFEGGIAFREIDLEQRNVPVEVAEAMREAGKPRGR